MIWKNLPMRRHLSQPLDAGILIGRIRSEAGDHSVDSSATSINTRFRGNLKWWRKDSREEA